MIYDQERKTNRRISSSGATISNNSRTILNAKSESGNCQYKVKSDDPWSIRPLMDLQQERKLYCTFQLSN